MNKVLFYNFNGELVEERLLNADSVCACLGMKVRCFLNDGSVHIGYANPYYVLNKPEIKARYGMCLTLEIIRDLDEENRRASIDFEIDREYIQISAISHIDAILYSGLRWGCVPTNEFNLKIK